MIWIGNTRPILQIAAVQQRAIEDRRTGLTDSHWRGVCRGVGEFLFFHRGWSWLCVNGTNSGRRAPVPCWNSPLQPSWSSGSSSHWHCSGWRSKMVSRAFFHLSSALLLLLQDTKKVKNVFLLLEKEINWMCRVCQWWQSKPNSWFLVKT